MEERGEDDYLSSDDLEESGFNSKPEEEEEEEEAWRTSRKKDIDGSNKKVRMKASSTNSLRTDPRKRGVCYLSRIPRHMDHVKLRHILSQYGDVERIYLVPENPSAHMHRKRAGGYRGMEFSEGWVEFGKKSVAKRVANMLNGEQMGGKRRSAFYYDLWNIKYLRKFKWDDLTEEIAYKHAVREQKMALEISAAKRERDFYLSKVDQSHALNSMQERAKKKQKTEATEEGNNSDDSKKINTKVIRQFPQNRPVIGTPGWKRKSGLSKDILAGVFGRTTS